MTLWYKFTEKLPEVEKELVLRFNENGFYSHQSAMAIEEYDLAKREHYISIEYGLKYDSSAYKEYYSCEMYSHFRVDEADEEKDVEWCYLEDLLKQAGVL